MIDTFGYFLSPPAGVVVEGSGDERVCRPALSDCTLCQGQATIHSTRVRICRLELIKILTVRLNKTLFKNVFLFFSQLAIMVYMRDETETNSRRLNKMAFNQENAVEVDCESCECVSMVTDASFTSP